METLAVIVMELGQMVTTVTIADAGKPFNRFLSRILRFRSLTLGYLSQRRRKSVYSSRGQFWGKRKELRN